MAAFVFLTALIVRAVRHPLVFTPSGVDFPFLGDLYYHVRRIWFTAANFPEILSHDPYVSFPDGAQIVWPGAFDGLIGALAWLLVGGESQARVEEVAVWVPPVLGAVTAAAASWIAQPRYGRPAALLAGGIFAFLPASFVFSQLGQLDHHVGVALLAAGLLGAGLAVMEKPGRSTAVALGVMMAGIIGLWPGALLHVLVVEVGLAVWTFGAADGRSAASRAGVLSAAHALAALLLAPFCIGRVWEAFGAWTPWALSNFQPVWLGAVAAALAVAGAAFRRTSAGRSPVARMTFAAALAVVASSVSLVLIAPLQDSLSEASGWFGQTEEFQSHVAELRPLLYPKGRFELRSVVTDFGLAGLFFPLAWLALFVTGWRHRRSSDGLLLWFAASFMILTLNQRRFENTLAVPYALVWGAVLGDLAPRAWRSLAGHRLARGLVAAGMVLGLLLSAGSVVNYYVPFLGQAQMASASFPPPRSPVRTQQRLFERAGRFLAANSPPTRGYLDPSVRPEYGVLCNWGVGHLLRYRAERPMVQDNFGVYGGRRTFDLAWAYFAAEEESEAVAIARSLRARYVVADPLGAGSRKPYAPRSLARRLAQFYGSEHDLPGGRGRVPALAHHRLLFHTSGDDRAELVTQRRDLAVAVFEIVAGARIDGLARPASNVEVSLPIRTGEGRRHRYRVTTVADGKGRWSVTVPYPTDVSWSPDLAGGASYRARSAEREAAFEVPEAAVRGGDTVPGPNLGAGE